MHGNRLYTINGTRYTALNICSTSDRNAAAVVTLDAISNDRKHPDGDTLTATTSHTIRRTTGRHGTQRDGAGKGRGTEKVCTI